VNSNRKNLPKSEWFGPTARILQSVYSCKSPVPLFIAKAQQTRYETGVGGPPFNPGEYAKALGITVEEKEDMTLDGILKYRGKGGFLIQLKKDAQPYRKNFTLAHEIAHTFFYDVLVQARQRNDNSISFRGNNFDQEEERLCDIAAAELLMPFDKFSSDLLQSEQDEDITPEKLFWLMDRYQVSLSAVAIRATWIIRNLACAFWRRRQHAINLEWVTPKSLSPLVLCQTGRSSIEEALKGPPGRVITKVDTFYYCPGYRSKIIRKTSSLKTRSGQVISVLLPTREDNSPECPF